MYLCVCVCVCEEDIHRKRKINENEKRKEEKNLFIQMNRRTDGEIDRHKSFIDMRYNTK